MLILERKKNNTFYRQFSGLIIIIINSTSFLFIHSVALNTFFFFRSVYSIRTFPMTIINFRTESNILRYYVTVTMWYETSLVFMFRIFTLKMNCFASMLPKLRFWNGEKKNKLYGQTSDKYSLVFFFLFRDNTIKEGNERFEIQIFHRKMWNLNAAATTTTTTTVVLNRI